MSSEAAGARIQESIRALRREVSKGVLRGLFAWSGALLLLLLLASVGLSGASGWRQGSLAPLLIALVALSSLACAFHARQRLVRKWGADARLGAKADDALGLVPGTVLGGLELARDASPGVSKPLRAVALHQTGAKLESSAPKLRSAVREALLGFQLAAARVLVVLAALNLVVLAVFPSETMRAWRGVVHPLAVLAESALPPPTVEPGNIETPRGAVIDARVIAPERAAATLRWEMVGEIPGSVALVLREGEGAARLPPAHSAIRYWAETPDGGRSPTYEIVPVDPLFVRSLSVSARYPEHTGLPEEEFSGTIPPLLLPEGTLLRISGSASKEVRSAELLGEDGESVLELEAAGEQFQGSWIPDRSGRYGWRIADAMGARAEAEPDPLVVELVSDASPRIAFASPEDGAELPLTGRQPLVLETSDDYGVERVEIVWERATVFGETDAPEVIRIDASGARAAVVRHVLDASGARPRPGDEIRYHARAIDNRPGGGQVATTETRVLAVPEAAEVEEAVARELREQAKELEVLAERARDASRRLEESEASLSRGEEASFADRERAQRALEEQRELWTRVDSLRAEMETLRRAMEEAGLDDGAGLKQLEDLAELLRDAAPEGPGAERFKDPSSLRDLDPDALSEALERLAQGQDQAHRQLEEAVDRFRRAANERDLKASAERSDELARRQELLSQAMEEGGDEALRAAQQQELLERAEELSELLQALEQRLEGTSESWTEAGIERAREELGQAMSRMENAARGAREGRRSDAAREAGQAAGDLSRISDGLEEMREDAQTEEMERMRLALEAVAGGAVSLARGQTELNRRIAQAGPRELAGLRADANAAREGVERLAEAYVMETGMAAPGARELLSAVGAAMESLEGATRAMGTRATESAARALGESAVQSLNEVARLALEQGDAEGGEASSSSSAEQQMMEMLAELAGQQGEISQEAASLAPMRLDAGTEAGEMEELASSQEAIARELGEMTEEQEPGATPLGDLQSMEEEARELARALASGRLDPEVLRRQERLFHRLLDAGRSLERDEESKERESDRPGVFTPRDARALTQDEIGGARIPFPDRAALQLLSPAQRALAIRYFERLNAERRGGSN